MKLNEKFIKKYDRLVEYKVNDVNQTKPLYSNDIEVGFIKEEDPTLSNDETLPEEMPSKEPVKVEQPVDDDSKLDKKTEILKDLAQNHTDKIDSILDYLETLSIEIIGMKQKGQEIDLLKHNMGAMEKQIDFLTPPTPEESLEKMVRISGGQTIDDYWKEYLAKQGKTVVGKMPYYQNGVTTDEKAQIINIKYSDDEIKKSLGL